MRFPIIAADAALLDQVKDSLKLFSDQLTQKGNSNADWLTESVALAEGGAAIEYINYQTPALLGINFSDDKIDGFEIMEKIVADPWLNHGAIIAFYEGSEVLEKINTLRDTNVVISLPFQEVGGLFLRVLHVIQENEQILFQRAIHSEFVSSLSGSYRLDPDIQIIPCYANLVANYLYNMGFVDGDSKYSLALSLSEMLINAIEHGVCGIDSDEKTAYLENNSTTVALIAEKCRDPKIGGRKVSFQYDIQAEGSTYVIADGGEGFDWRSYVDEEREVDLFSLHGRGIMLSKASVDKIGYNEKGNTVTLSLIHRQNTTNTVPLVFQDHETLVVAPGDPVFQQGEESDFLYYIAEGEYGVEINGVVVATVTPADILVGEISFLLQDNRSATVVAKSHGKLIKISKEAFVNSIKAQPYYGLFLAKLLAQRLVNLGRKFTS
ncbi:MAG: cyclic nucleotide-binding domain-containing protein [bacterium]